MGKVTPIFKSATKALAKANAQVETAFNLIALSRRRTGAMLDDSSVMVTFATEIEAKEFQKLIHSMPKRRK